MKLYVGADEIKGVGFHVTAGDIKDATTEPEEVLNGQYFYNNEGRQTGTMPNMGAVSAALNAGQSYDIPEGYHNGEGKVTANSLASQTTGTAAAANIEAGYTAWVNGAEVEGEGIIAGEPAMVLSPIQQGLLNTGSANHLKNISNAGQKRLLVFGLRNDDGVIQGTIALVDKDSVTEIFRTTQNPVNITVSGTTVTIMGNSNTVRSYIIGAIEI